MKKLSGIKILYCIYKTLFQYIPASALLTALNYASRAFLPLISTVISVHMFNYVPEVIARQEPISQLFLYGTLYFLSFFINDMLFYVASITMNAGVYEKGTSYFRKMLFEKIARIPYIDFEDTDIIDKRNRAESAVNDEVLSSIFNRSLMFLSSMISIVGVIAVLSSYSIWLLPLSLFSVIFFLVSSAVHGGEHYRLKTKQIPKMRLIKYLWSLFNERNSVKEMRIMGFDKYVMQKWQNARDDVKAELWTLEKKEARATLICEIISVMGYATSIIVVLILVIQGRITIGVFGAVLTAFTSVQSNLKVFLADLGRLPGQLSYAKDYYSFLSLEDEPDGKLEFEGLQRHISVEGLSFSYPNSTELALKDVSFLLNKGEKIAIVGENGSGKTTLSKLMLGMYRPLNGSITYDDFLVSKIKKESLSKHISLVQQNFVPYFISIRENIAMGELAQLNNTKKIISTLNSAGLNTLAEVDLDMQMGKEFDGIELSQGQWQKVAIARALFCDKEFICLDEPTAALDPLIETEILNDFLVAAKNKTAIIITHRVGICTQVDRILVLKNGRLTESGSHEDLMRLGGEYRRLFEMQQQWYL